MTDAQTILRMIETVDPSDTGKLDEIDARFWCYLNHHEYIGDVKYTDIGDRKAFPYKPFDAPEKKHWCVVGERSVNPWSADLYTRSRDALKAIRPEGWFVSVSDYVTHAKEYQFEILKIQEGRPRPKFEGQYLPTEELAELYCIIQAIEFERTKK